MRYFSEIRQKNLSWAKWVGLTALCSFLILGLFHFKASIKPEYVVLTSSLRSEESVALIQLLREKKIPFSVDSSGNSLSVPGELVTTANALMASMKGNSPSIVGYEVFDRQSLGTTALVQKLNQKRAREGELTRTINSIRGVKHSRVHLAIPDKSLFLEDRRRPTASVVLDIDDGVKLAQKQIFGIASLISRAIEGLDPKDIAIVDSNGKMLWGSEIDSSSEPLVEGPVLAPPAITASAPELTEPTQAATKPMKSLYSVLVSNPVYVALVIGFLGVFLFAFALTRFVSTRSSQRHSVRDVPPAEGERNIPVAPVPVRSSLEEIRSGVVHYVREDSQRAAAILTTWLNSSHSKSHKSSESTSAVREDQREL